MKLASISFLAMAIGCLASCTNYKLDVGTTCDSAKLADLAGEKDDKKKLATQLEWARRNVHSSEGQALVTKIEGCALGGVPSVEPCKVWTTAAAELRRESVNVGRKECALADWMDKTQQAIIDRNRGVR